MSVLDRAALEDSPLADLHAIASELSLDGYRRLRKDDLIDAIIAQQEGTEVASGEDDAATVTAAAEEGAGASRRRRGRRGGRGRGADRDGDGADRDGDTEEEADRDADKAEPVAADKPAPSGRRRGGRGRSAEPAGDGADADADADRKGEAEDAGEEETVIEGVVELLANGSGFVRVSPPEASDEDVYISAAQVKRCELVSGDRVTGPKRLPRRSERFASLVRIDTINGRPAAELADGARYDDLAATFPTERFRLGSEDPTLQAIEFLTPFGRGSRVTIVGGFRSGKSHALRALAQALVADEALHLFVALAGVRPEELPDWSDGPVTPAGAVSFAVSSDAQDHVVELVVDQARRIAARGADAVVLVDTLDGLHPHTARKVLAAARNIVDGGSLTVIATSTDPLGGETTVIALDPLLATTGRFPAIDMVRSGTIRAELLVGAEAAAAIAERRAEAL
jgi:transcription termination factor Rho